VAATGSGYFSTRYAEDLEFARTNFRKVALAIVAGAVLAYPLLVSNYYTYIGALVAIGVIAALSLNLLMGYAGIVSLGHAAFMAIGAYTATYLAIDLNLPFLLVVPLSGLVAAGVGVLVGIPSLRWRGLYIVLGTFALHFIVRYFILRYEFAKVGTQGFQMPEASVGPWAINSDNAWYYFLVVTAVLFTLGTANIVRSRVGRAWMAIRDRDIVASIIGINVAQYKVMAFAISSFMIGVAGALQGYFLGHVTSDLFTLYLTVQFIAMILIGGRGSVEGSILGAIFVTTLPFIIDWGMGQAPTSYPYADIIQRHVFDIEAMVFGFAIIGFLLFEPGGLVAILGRFKTYFSLWPFRYRRLSER
jgi:branched-chain amino acid transport system permease protein